MTRKVLLYLLLVFSGYCFGQNVNIFYIDNFKVHPNYSIKEKIDSIWRNSEKASKVLLYYSNELQPIVMQSEADTIGFWLKKRNLSPNLPTLSADLDSLIALLYETKGESFNQYYFISEASLKVNQQYIKSLVDRINLVLHGSTGKFEFTPVIFIMPAELEANQLNITNWSKTQRLNYKIIPYAAQIN